MDIIPLQIEGPLILKINTFNIFREKVLITKDCVFAQLHNCLTKECRKQLGKKYAIPNFGQMSSKDVDFWIKENYNAVTGYKLLRNRNIIVKCSDVVFTNNDISFGYNFTDESINESWTYQNYFVFSNSSRDGYSGWKYRDPVTGEKTNRFVSYIDIKDELEKIVQYVFAKVILKQTNTIVKEAEVYENSDMNPSANINKNDSII